MISTFNIKLPKELSKKVEREANLNNVSVDEYVVYLLTKIISYQEAQKDLQIKLKRKNRLSAMSVLEKVPDIAPLNGDEI